MAEVAVDLGVTVPEDDLILAALTLRRQPDGQLALQMHPIDTFPIRATSELLRWLACRLEIEALEVADGPGGG
jgi:hypothetical protein